MEELAEVLAFRTLLFALQPFLPCESSLRGTGSTVTSRIGLTRSKGTWLNLNGIGPTRAAQRL
jgi:hypothetical protein